MFATKHYLGPFWQSFFLTAVFCLLSFDSAKAVTEQPVDYSSAELEELVGPVALYPDDLLGIILPASTYPLQIVQAARYLAEHEKNPELQPDEDWDDSVVALLNYPEVIELMNDDLDWTWNLGEAVVNQQSDVLDAIQDFRGRAVVAGNFESDDRQTVSVVDDIIEVTPVDPEVIYVPYYEPSRVVIYQRWPVYHYYPRPYPVYYYPYPVHYSFASGFFWGVTTAYTIGWLTDRVHFHYYGYASHPYYGHHYTTHYYARHAQRVRHYRYSKPRSHFVYNRHNYGNTWKPEHRYGDRPRHRRADRHQTVASNFTSSTRGTRSSAGARVRTGGDRHSSTRFRSSQDEQTTRSRDTRNRNTVTRSSDRRRQAEGTRTNARVAVRDESRNRNTSRRNSNTNSRSGSNQIIDTRSQRRASRSDARTPRRVGEQADTSRRTTRRTRGTKSVSQNRAVRRSSGSTTKATRNQNRAQPRQQRRQASRPSQSKKRTASPKRSANKSSGRANKRSTTRVARASSRGSQSRYVGGSTRRGYRR